MAAQYTAVAKRVAVTNIKYNGTAIRVSARASFGSGSGAGPRG